MQQALCTFFRLHKLFINLPSLVTKSIKKSTKFLPWPLKRGQIKKGELYTPNWMILFWLSNAISLISPLFKCLCRNPGNKFVLFLKDLKTPKGHFEVKWPLQFTLWKCPLEFAHFEKKCPKEFSIPPQHQQVKRVVADLLMHKKKVLLK